MTLAFDLSTFLRLKQYRPFSHPLSIDIWAWGARKSEIDPSFYAGVIVHPYLYTLAHHHLGTEKDAV